MVQLNQGDTMKYYTIVEIQKMPKKRRKAIAKAIWGL
jgi:hypothetical protein